MNDSLTIQDPLVATPGVSITGTIKTKLAYSSDGEHIEYNPGILIEISEQNTKELYPPIVMAYNELNNEIVTVDALVLLPIKEFEPQKFLITQQHVYAADGTNQLNLYISYSSAEVCTNKYLPVSVSFKTDPVYVNGDLILIDAIQTFFRNRDPKTSRGTVTTVRRPM